MILLLLTVAATSWAEECSTGPEPACSCLEQGAYNCFATARRVELGDDQSSTALERASKLYACACARGHAGACYAAGWLHWNQLATPPCAEHFFQTACAGNDANGCVGLGKVHRAAERGNQGAIAIESFLKACSLQNETGCFLAAVMYEAGGQIDRNRPEARALYQRGCDWGDHRSCVNLGFMAEAGWGGPRDATAALRLFSIACGGGDTIGCTKEALALTGSTDSADTRRAQQLLEEACSSAEPHACWVLAKSVRKIDPHRARSLRRFACEVDPEGACGRSELASYRAAAPAASRLD